MNLSATFACHHYFGPVVVNYILLLLSFVFIYEEALKRNDL
jgi:hypothetical protein